MSTVEIREIPEPGGPPEDRAVRLETHASVTGVWYPIGGGVQEKIVPQAFARSLATRPEMVLLINHGRGGGLPLAHTRGTPPLEVCEDETGLLATADLNPRDPDVQSLRAKAESMPLEASFSFRCNRDRWNAEETRREVLEVNLAKADITITPFGANPETDVSVRGKAFNLEERRAFRERIAGRVIGPGFALDERSSRLTVARTSMLPASSVEAERAAKAKAIAGVESRAGPKY